MGCVRQGKKQKQGPKTLSKEEATGRLPQHVIEAREERRAMTTMLRNPELMVSAGLLALTRLGR